MAMRRDLEFCPVGHYAVRRLEEGLLYCAACGGAPWPAGEVEIDVRRICQGHRDRNGRQHYAPCRSLREHHQRFLREASGGW